MENPTAAARTPATRRRIVITGVALAAMVALSLGFFVRRATQNLAPVSADALLAVGLPDLQGVEQRMSQWRGKVLVVNFWGTWCAPCREEMPRFVVAQRELGPKGVQFLGIAIDDVAKIRQFAQEMELNYPTLVGGYGAMELSKTYGNRLMALPFTLVIDRQGRITHTQLGPLEEPKLRSLLAALI